MGDHKNLADLLWGEDTDTESDAIEEAQGAALDRLNLDRAETFRKLLADVFPHGTPEKPRNRGPIVVARSIGDHWVGLVGAVKPGDSDVSWEGFWRMDVMMNVEGRRPPRGGKTIEAASRRITSDQGVIGWLSWVHWRICKAASETVRLALDPDAFLKDMSRAFRAGYVLHLLKADWDDIGPLIIQRLPWREAKGGQAFACTVLAKTGVIQKEQIGILGVKPDNTAGWRYGGNLDVGEVNPFFAGMPLKFKHQAGVAICPTLDAAVERAEALYARKITEWLMKYGQQEGLRTHQSG